MADDIPHVSDREEAHSEPPVVLPVPDMPSFGMASSSVSSTSALISPQPLVDVAGSEERPSLADTVERELASDGRFAAFMSMLVITVDGATVHLSGTVPGEPQKQSLLRAVRGVPGVGSIVDEMRVG